MNSRCWSWKALCLNLLFCLLLSLIGNAQAETSTRFGLSFPVDEVAELSPSALRVKVLGETFIAHPDEVSDKVAELYLRNEIHSRRFTQEQLEDFMFEAASARNVAMTVLAMKNLVKRPDVDISSLDERLDELLGLPGAIKIAQAAAPVLAKLNAEDLTPLYAVFVFIAEYNLKWAKSNLIEVATDHRAGLLSYMQRQFDRSIRERRFSRAERLMLIVMDLFGTTEPVYQELADINSKAERLQELLKSFNARELYAFVELCRDDPRMEELFGGLVLESLHAAIDRALQAQDADGALEILARMDFNKRTPRTHELAKRSIDTLPLFSSTFNDSRVIKLFSSLSEVDQGFRQAYFHYLLREVREAIRAKRWLRADNSLRRLIKIRPDPNPQNDELRFEIALAMVKAGLAEEARAQIESLSTGLSISKRLALVFSGYYVSRGVLWCAILLLVLIPFVLYLRERIQLVRAVESGMKRGPQRPPSAVSDGRSRPRRGSVSEDEAPGGFSYSTIRRGLSPRMYEYVGLLRMFELGPEASVKMIKVAYRSAIKEVHPDLNPNPSEEQSQRFLDLTSAYERIVELREQLGLVDD